MIYIITNAAENLAQTVTETKDFWDYFSILSTFLLSFATIMVATRQYYISKQQKDIALYKERYEKLYLLILNTIDRLQTLMISRKNFNTEEFMQISKDFCKDIDYARFLIKEDDFNRIMDIYSTICNQLNNHFNRTCPFNSEEWLDSYLNLDKTVGELKNEFIDIIQPYLQIENDDFFVKICKSIYIFCKKVYNYLRNLINAE